MLAAYVVNSTSDVPVSGKLTLREAVVLANNSIGLDTITFSTAASDALNGATITLTQGALSISDSVTIDASLLASGITIDASGNDSTPTVNDLNGSSMFRISLSLATDVVTFNHLTMTGADFAGVGGAVGIDVADEEALIRLEDCRLSDNFAGQGGALGSGGGRIEISNSVFENNAAFNLGGGVYLFGSVTSAAISNSQFLTNHGSDGGGLYVHLTGAEESQTVDITGCLFSGNTADGLNGGGSGYGGAGGGIYADLHGSGFQPAPALTISTTTLDHNSADHAGGGAFFVGKWGANADIRDTTVSNNRAGLFDDDPETVEEGQGGGLWLGNDRFQDSVNQYDLKQVTVSGNEADSQGGGVWVGHTMYLGTTAANVDANLDFVTISNNHAPDGGGLFSEIDSLVTTTLQNTIMSGNTIAVGSSTANNVAGDIDTSSKYNLLGSGGGAVLPSQSSPLFNIWSDAPGLSALGNYGGPTQTHGLLAGSPALDAGDPAVTFNALEFDQRGAGFSRVVNIASITLPNRGPVDIGAYEVGLARIVDVVVNGKVSASGPVWDAGVSFAEKIKAGEQLRPIAAQGANVIEIHFDGPVSFAAGTNNGKDTLELAKTVRGAQINSAPTTTFIQGSAATAYSYDTNTFVAKWTFADGTLVDGKYAVFLETSTVTGLVGAALDGDWDYSTHTVLAPDSHFLDDAPQLFASGDGTPDALGGVFRLNFAILAGDYAGSGEVEGSNFYALSATTRHEPSRGGRQRRWRGQRRGSHRVD
jgi:hypothetical protein